MSSPHQLYIDSGQQHYINPSFIRENENYYTSPIISNPPVPNPSSMYGMQDPYANYYNYYNNYYQQGNCGCAGQYGMYGGFSAGQYGYQGCQGCPGYSGYGWGLPTYGSQQGGCGCSNCAQYGLAINRDRITPRFPSKLGHSFVTSNPHAQTRQVITEPSSQSAPFQTQRRKTYQPYTRKYIEYQDYIQFIPVQRSEWNYKKVMKQIDFVPQEYYETSVEMVPREKIEQKLRYIPVEKEFVHVPNDVLNLPAQQTDFRVVGQKIMRNTLQASGLSSTVKPDVYFAHQTSNIPLQSSGVFRNTNSQANRQVLHTIYEQNANPSIIHPAESTVEMVPNTRLHSLNQPPSQKTTSFGISNQQGTYRFPTTGGVIIGSSSRAESIKENPIMVSFGPNRFETQHQTKPAVNIEASEVVHSGYGTHAFRHNANVNPSSTVKEGEYGRNFRQSGHVESEDFNFDPTEYHKKQSIVNRFDDDLN